MNSRPVLDVIFKDKAAANLAFEVLFWTGIRSGELLALGLSEIKRIYRDVKRRIKRKQEQQFSYSD
jgi:integrase